MIINANATGTRTIEVTEDNMRTIQRYSLFERIANSVGIIDEESLEKLRYTVRSLIVSQGNDTDALVGLCWVLFDDNMKAYGLNNLIACYRNWLSEQQTKVLATENTDDER